MTPADLSSAPAIKAIAALARQAANLQIIADPDLAKGADASASAPLAAPLVLVPEGLRLESLLPHLDPPPVADAHFEEVPSFIAYVNRYATDDTLLAVEPAERRFRALIDYHAAPEATLIDATTERRPCRHFATLELALSPELEEWKPALNAWVSQTDLAEWLEDHAHQVSQPTPADILTLARSLHVTKDVKFTSHKRAADGSFDFSYRDNSTGKAGDLEVPTRITVTIPLFHGAPPSDIDCLLRYRLAGDAVQFRIRPLRLEETLRQAIQDARAAIHSATHRHVHAGDVFRHQLAAAGLAPKR